MRGVVPVLAAVHEAASNADFVLFYHHFQIDRGEFSDVSPGDSTGDGHFRVDDVPGWKTEFARSVLDGGETYREDFDDLEFLSGRGLGQLAREGRADSILSRLRDLSAGYGTHLEMADSLATLVIEPGNRTAAPNTNRTARRTR